MIKYLKFSLLFLPFFAKAQYPVAIESVLQKAGINKSELVKALQYSTKTGDSLKIKAMQFLIANMDIHFSSDYYWEDSSGKKIVFNEFDFPDYSQAQTALINLKEKTLGIKQKPIITNDIEAISSDYLIENLENAFSAWKNSSLKTTSFNDFCEYILPYRISIEPLQEWRLTYAEKFNWINKDLSTKDFQTVLMYVKDDFDSWFTNTWKEKRDELLPRLGSKHLLFRKQGACADIANLSAFALRSQGIAAAVNIIPYWATATEGHFTNTFFDQNNQIIHCDYGTRDFRNNLPREPAKVLRITYSKNPSSLASFENQNNIPKGFLQKQNYIDVTPEYWKTTNVICPLFPNPNMPSVVYATTFNGLAWKPFWWSLNKNNQAEFSSLCIGTVIIPQYYINGKLSSAGYPVIINENKTRVLEPSLKHTDEIIIAEKDRYLKFKPGITYKLFYWDSEWKILGSQSVNNPITEMKFENVPKNALLLLLASDSKGLERPFTIDDKNERTWY